MSKEKSQPIEQPVVAIAASDQILAAKIGDSLRKHGIIVRVFKKACETSFRLDNEKFDCLIIDCLLQSGTADQIILSSRRSPRTQNATTPIILMSRNFDAELLKRYESDIYDSIRKPFDLAQLIDKVRAICDKTASSLAREVA